jgi:DNA-directed RNA polymerase I subunit RPA2
VSRGGQYPGLYLFSTPARMIRPVQHLGQGALDMVGPFEQVYMDIACLPEDVVPGVTTHIEEAPTSMLSVVANLTPFSDFNQSPRNMYQCQMGKQSMGTPAQNLPHRTDNKMYRLQTGQTPVVRPELHDDYGLDGYPNGMNAVVCVISYTGYDMEDASIMNRSAHDRGYGYGTVIKGEWVDLGDHRRRGEPISHHFGFVTASGLPARMRKQDQERVGDFLDDDGLPMVGVRLTAGDPLYAYIDDATGRVKVVAYKGPEDAYVDQVRLVGADGPDPGELQRVHIKLRIPRPPIIGDKFSSRHGQKGVISQKWPAVDMPFSESGIVPDVIINPHAFPSRMTIGMFVESLAGKSGALHGRAQDATPFRFSEDRTASAFFGEELAQAGFNYYGNEPMYSGITGEEFKADIYIGVVYYQRLRHMVSDKYQVRTTGPIDNLTHQPIKGRKRAGGIRFGEMERDSLLAHGVSFLLQDRLMNCSDYSQAHACRRCGSILSPLSVPLEGAGAGAREVRCQTCRDGGAIDALAIPYVFRYLCTELVAMGVRLRLDIA